MIETPKNLTKNILLGMLLGFVVGATFYYVDFLPKALTSFLEVYIFNLGGSIFINLLLIKMQMINLL